MTIGHRIERIRETLPPSVKLIAVTKQVPVEKMREAYNAGIRDFAESKIQEALPKIEAFRDCPDLNWHFIGHIQSNKIKKILEHFPYIHSIDSLALARKLNAIAGEAGIVPRVYLQVKVLPDPDKYGWEVPALMADLPELENYRSLKIIGLMNILPLGLTELEKSLAFFDTKKLAKTIEQNSSLTLPELSMGMSDDYYLAIAAGATSIRLGRILFGERD